MYDGIHFVMHIYCSECCDACCTWHACCHLCRHVQIFALMCVVVYYFGSFYVLWCIIFWCHVHPIVLGDCEIVHVPTSFRQLCMCPEVGFRVHEL